MVQMPSMSYESFPNPSFGGVIINYVALLILMSKYFEELYKFTVIFFWENSTCSDFMSLATITATRKILALPGFNIFYFLRAWNQHQGKKLIVGWPPKWRFKSCPQSWKWWCSRRLKDWLSIEKGWQGKLGGAEGGGGGEGRRGQQWQWWQGRAGEWNTDCSTDLVDSLTVLSPITVAFSGSRTENLDTWILKERNLLHQN